MNNVMRGYNREYIYIINSIIRSSLQSPAGLATVSATTTSSQLVKVITGMALVWSVELLVLVCALHPPCVPAPGLHDNTDQELLGSPAPER